MGRVFPRLCRGYVSPILRWVARKNLSRKYSDQDRLPQSGFSVLEAMIAMAILAAALLPLLALQGQFVRSVDSFSRLDTRLTARASAVHYLSALNMSRSQTGRYQLDVPRGSGLAGDIVEIRWTAKPALVERAARAPGGTRGRFVMILYDVHVEIWTTHTNLSPTGLQTGLQTGPQAGPPTVPRKMDQFEMRGLGWRATRGILEGI